MTSETDIENMHDMKNIPDVPLLLDSVVFWVL